MNTTILLDVVFAIGTMVLFYYISKESGWSLIGYLTMPLLLMWVHVVGNAMQELDIGSEIVQDHVHDLGVGCLLLPAGVIGYMRLRCSGATSGRMSVANGLEMTKLVTRSVPWAYACGTVICVLYKVAQITVFRERTLAQGYSGQLDFGDVSAMLLGLLLVLVSHWMMRGRAIRKATMRTVDKTRSHTS